MQKSREGQRTDPSAPICRECDRLNVRNGRNHRTSKNVFFSNVVPDRNGLSASGLRAGSLRFLQNIQDAFRIVLVDIRLRNRAAVLQAQLQQVQEAMDG